MPSNGVEEWRAWIGQWENRKLRWYQAHSRSRRRVPLNLGRLIAESPRLCLLLLLLLAVKVATSICEAGKDALSSLGRLAIRGRCCVRSLRARPTPLFSFFLALSLLLVIAGDVETNPGPISGEKATNYIIISWKCVKTTLTQLSSPLLRRFSGASWWFWAM